MKKWWHSAVGYQIYPKSFQDSNGDGIGDIKGIISRLPYLKELGISVIWLSPINQSPMKDHGYDISDYYHIDPSFGSDEDFENLITEAKKYDIRILLDLVINHTSVKHEWFQKALADLDSPYADYYMIREGNGNLPPNNWRSMFGGSAWERIEGTNKYYLHLFTVDQPDLNWENPKLRKELYHIIQFWLNKGVAGFRIDAIAHIKKVFDAAMKEADGPDGLAEDFEHYRNAKGIEQFLAEMRDQAFAGQDILTIAEMDVPNPNDWVEFFGDNGYFSSIFDFYHTIYNVQSEEFKDRPVELVEKLKERAFEKQTLAHNKVFFTNFIENHDLPRSPERLIPKEEIHFYSKSLLAVHYFFLRGIPVVYQGQEIGMQDYPKNSISEYIDLATHNKYQEYLLRGKSPEEALSQINIENRENSRTPFQWSTDQNAGFTEGEPWFEVNPNYVDINYEKQEQDADSLLNFYKRLIKVRRNIEYEDVFVYGRTLQLFKEVKGCFAYKRQLGDKEVTVICNFTNQSLTIDYEYDAATQILMNNYKNIQYTQGLLSLNPYQAIVIG
ncbi:glucohydrolase [Streptococcus cuniculi]|uniref:Glucan 1,6-alpha-glucosidase n=1 Tax=Streptococcus cuniculi TaxID=1432788 RepID=A0A1Q8E7G4_9STRE|nr:alpha-glucosidase [Streptococcus cuniculi]OLF47741.1 glucohydrolase [Streptococcus cuniculi]